MKRIALLLPAFLLALLLTGCGREAPATPDTYLPSIMLDGVLYHLSDKGECRATSIPLPYKVK